MHPRPSSHPTTWAALALLTTLALPAHAQPLAFGVAFVDSQLGSILLSIAKVLGILLVGWGLAKLIALAVFKVLCKTDWDDKLAAKLGLTLLMEKEQTDSHAVERAASAIVYYTLMTLVIVAALQFSGLTLVAEPIQNLVEALFGALPKIGVAILILGGAWVIGTILRIVISKAFKGLKIDEKLSQLSETTAESQPAIGDAIGNVVFWLLMVFGLAGALQHLEIHVISVPLQNAIDQLISVLPQLAKATLIIIVAYIIARIVRTIADNFLASIGLNRLTTKLKLEKVFERRSASNVAASILFFFILLQASIAALNELRLDTLSSPLTNMMARFWTILPDLALAAIIIIIGIVIARVVRSIVEGVLKSIGFDRILEKLGLGKIFSKNESIDEPSEIVGLITMIAIILLASAQALELIGLNTWSFYLNTFLAYLLQHVAIAIIIVAIGLAIGNHVRNLIIGHGKDESRHWLAMLARYTILVLAFTMAVHQLGVSQTFVILVFALLFGALCLALALAFGLGGREVAEDIVKRQYSKVKEQFDATKK